MSSVISEIQRLAALADVRVDDIHHFITGISGSPTVVGGVILQVPGDHCAVVIKIEEFNADEALARTVTLNEAGALVTEVRPADWSIGADVFQLFPPGRHTIVLSATPQGGKRYFARVSGYMLPQSAFQRLSRMATKFLS